MADAAPCLHSMASATAHGTGWARVGVGRPAVAQGQHRPACPTRWLLTPNPARLPGHSSTPPSPTAASGGRKARAGSPALPGVKVKAEEGEEGGWGWEGPGMSVVGWGGVCVGRGGGRCSSAFTTSPHFCCPFVVQGNNFCSSTKQYLSCSHHPSQAAGEPSGCGLRRRARLAPCWAVPSLIPGRCRR